LTIVTPIIAHRRNPIRHSVVLAGKIPSQESGFRPPTHAVRPPSQLWSWKGNDVGKHLFLAFPRGGQRRENQKEGFPEGLAFSANRVQGGEFRQIWMRGV
jgi:hypothetical protein